MSYPRDLDEYPESELLNELALRRRRRIAGTCDYCDVAVGEPTSSGAPSCRFPSRHAGDAGALLAVATGHLTVGALIDHLRNYHDAERVAICVNQTNGPLYFRPIVHEGLLTSGGVVLLSLGGIA